MIRTEDLHRSYTMGDQLIQAVDGVELDIRHGETVALLGPSGSGKSTLMHLLGALDTPSAGRIIAVDLHDDKLAMAERFGATDTIRSEPGGDDYVVAEVFELTGGEGANYVFEVVGVPEVVRLGWDCLRVDGTLVAVVHFLCVAIFRASVPRTYKASEARPRRRDRVRVGTDKEAADDREAWVSETLRLA